MYYTIPDYDTCKYRDGIQCNHNCSECAIFNVAVSANNLVNNTTNIPIFSKLWFKNICVLCKSSFAIMEKIF